MRFSFIPPGSFLMGSPADEPERGYNEQLHLVTLTNGFWFGQTPVTQRQWIAAMRRNPSRHIGDELPVDSVSWNDTRTFITAVAAKVGDELRLPTEAEWEFATRGGTTTPYYWGSKLDGTQANCNGNFPCTDKTNGPNLGRSSVVGSYATVSPHPWNLVDISGNVWDWCADLYNVNLTGEMTDPKGPKRGSKRVIRGGGYGNCAMNCRSACRGSTVARWTSSGVGFRLAADLSALA
jgi:formylglycine-generating enzyme required for sulfatase activity